MVVRIPATFAMLITVSNIFLKAQRTNSWTYTYGLSNRITVAAVHTLTRYSTTAFRLEEVQAKFSITIAASSTIHIVNLFT